MSIPFIIIKNISYNIEVLFDIHVNLYRYVYESIYIDIYCNGHSATVEQ
jgi:hypothetical protein